MTGRKISLIAAAFVVALGALAAGGYFVVQSRIQAQIEDGLRQLAANPPPPYRAVGYDKVDFTLHDRRLVITGLKAEPGDSGDRISLARLELERFDPDVWQQAVGPRPADAKFDSTFRRLFDKGVVSDLSSVQGGQPGKADRATITGVDIRPIPTQAIATLRTLSPTERMKEVLSFVRVDSVVVEGVRSISAGREITFSRGEILGLRDDRFKSMVFEKLAHDQADGKFSLGRFELRDGISSVWFSPVEIKTADEKLSYFDFSSLKLAELRKGDSLVKENEVSVQTAEIGAINRQKFESLLVRDMRVIDRSTANPISVSVASLELRDLDWEQILPVATRIMADETAVGLQSWAAIGKLRYSLGKLSLDGMDFGPGVTVANASMRFQNDNGTGDLDFTLTDLLIKAADLRDRNMAAGLVGFGYGTLNLSMRTRVTGERQGGKAALEAFDVFGPQVGKLSASYAVSNYQEPAAGGDPMAQLLAANVDRVEIAWQDDGLTSRALAAAARQQRASITQLKAGLAAQLRQMMLPYSNSPRVVEVGEAALRYLDKPGALAISAKPARPVPVIEVVTLLEAPPNRQPDLPALFDLLEITATAR
jgi:hypothetical protein